MSVWASAHEFIPPFLPSAPLPVGQALSETVLELQVDQKEAARVIIKSESRLTYVDGKRCRFVYLWHLNCLCLFFYCTKRPFRASNERSAQVTGDLGQLLEPGHVLAVLGRGDSLVKLHGKAVSLLDIEVRRRAISPCVTLP